MKIGVYSNLQDELFINTLKSHTKVTEIFELNSKILHGVVDENGVSFRFNDMSLDENLDILIFRGGFSDVFSCLQIVKYCQNKGIKVFDNNLHKVRYFINKKIDTLNFSMAKLPVPKTYFLNELDTVIKANLPFPLIFKTINTGKGSNVFKVKSIHDVERTLKDTDKELKLFIFQEFIEYVHDLRIFVLGDEVVGVMKRIPGEGEFRANFSLGGNVEVFDASDDIKNLAIRAARSCNAEIAGVDILIDKEGKPYVLEVNRTPGTEGISEALGINVAEKVIDYILKNYS